MFTIKAIILKFPVALYDVKLEQKKFKDIITRNREGTANQCCMLSWCQFLLVQYALGGIDTNTSMRGAI